MIPIIGTVIGFFSVFVIAIESQTYVFKVAENVYGKTNEEKQKYVLYDLIQKLFYPYFVQQNLMIQNIICKFLDLSISLFIGILIFTAICYVDSSSSTTTSNAIEYVQNFVHLITILNIIRMIFYNCTVLPQTDFRPKKYNLNENSFTTVIKFLTFQHTEFGYRNDLIFSGHTCLIVLVNLMIEYYTSAPRIMKNLLWIVGIILSFILIVTKKHYTIDVLVAWVVTLLVFEKYFYYFY